MLPFDQAAADTFGIIATELARKGLPIGEFDTLIAVYALLPGLILVTNNMRHFERVSGLQVENWT